MSATSQKQTSKTLKALTTETQRAQRFSLLAAPAAQFITKFFSLRPLCLCGSIF
jgi:hypothetical protein